MRGVDSSRGIISVDVQSLSATEKMQEGKMEMYDSRYTDWEDTDASIHEDAAKRRQYTSASSSFNTVKK